MIWYNCLLAEYVKLGAWDKSLKADEDAGKEILLVAEKI